MRAGPVDEKTAGGAGERADQHLGFFQHLGDQALFKGAVILAIEAVAGGELMQAPAAERGGHFLIGSLEDGIEVRRLPEATGIEADAGVQIG
jgi:hypothetical protein